MFQRITAWLRMSADGLAARVTGQRDDELALARGWEIEHGRLGRRIYRDPRFAALRAATVAPVEPVAEPAGVPPTAVPPVDVPPLVHPLVPAQRTAELVPGPGSV